MYKLIIRTGLKVLLLYILWLFFFKGINYVSPVYAKFLNGFYELILYSIIVPTRWVVEILTGIKVGLHFNTLFFEGHGPFIINNECLAIKLLFVFAILIIALPGASLKNKIWFIPAGILVIHMMNIIRMVSLSLTIIYTPYFNFMHSFVFRVAIYLTVIALWYIWMKYFMDMKKIYDMMNPSELTKKS